MVDKLIWWNIWEKRKGQVGGMFDGTTWEKLKHTIYYNNINTDTSLMKKMVTWLYWKDDENEVKYMRKLNPYLPPQKNQ